MPGTERNGMIPPVENRALVPCLACLVAGALASCQCSSPNDTTDNATLGLFATYHSVGVTVEFGGDHNRSASASLRYSVDAGSWAAGPRMAAAEVPDNPERAWRASIYPLEPGAHVEVEVTIEDADNDAPILLSGSIDLLVVKREPSDRVIGRET